MCNGGAVVLACWSVAAWYLDDNCCSLFEVVVEESNQEMNALRVPKSAKMQPELGGLDESVHR